MGDDGALVTGRSGRPTGAELGLKFSSNWSGAIDEDSALAEPQGAKRERARKDLLAIEKVWEERISLAQITVTGPGAIRINEWGEKSTSKITRVNERDFEIEIIHPWNKNEQQGQKLLLSADALQRILAIDSRHSQFLEHLFPNR